MYDDKSGNQAHLILMTYCSYWNQSMPCFLTNSIMLINSLCAVAPASGRFPSDIFLVAAKGRLLRSARLLSLSMLRRAINNQQFISVIWMPFRQPLKIIIFISFHCYFSHTGSIN